MRSFQKQNNFMEEFKKKKFIEKQEVKSEISKELEILQKKYLERKIAEQNAKETSFKKV